MPPVPKGYRSKNLPPVRVIGPRDPVPAGHLVVNTTSRSGDWGRGLSPFFLGPVGLYDGYTSRTMENAWQYSKVYEQFAGFGCPNQQYWKWATSGWNNPVAVRYPMGKGIKPLYSWWDGERLTYVEARKRVYIPLYSKAVVETAAYGILLEMYLEGTMIALWDFDGYDHVKLGKSLSSVVGDPNRKMGHAFVLAMMLEGLL